MVLGNNVAFSVSARTTGWVGIGVSNDTFMVSFIGMITLTKIFARGTSTLVSFPDHFWSGNETTCTPGSATHYSLVGQTHLCILERMYIMQKMSHRMPWHMTRPVK